MAGEPGKALDFFEHAPPGNRELGRMLALHDLAFEYLERAIEREGSEFIQAINRGSDLYAPIMHDPRWQAFLDRYGADEKGDLSHIRFNPKLPAEVTAALATTDQ